MRNPEGTPIWYELLTNDSAASAKFYANVAGWKFGDRMPGNDKDYRSFGAETGLVGGMLQLTDDMRKGGAKPTWLFYVGVEDVDATVKKVEAAGGKLLMPAFDIPDIGRIAMIADPQGVPLYVMRGAVDQPSTAFEPKGMGKCCWHELHTPDQAAANDFYAKVFGWKYPDKMPMPGLGEYIFVQAADTTMGATMTTPPGSESGWSFYFRVPNVEEATERVKKEGGSIVQGPMDVPGGDRIVVTKDVHGVLVGFVSAIA